MERDNENNQTIENSSKAGRESASNPGEELTKEKILTRLVMKYPQVTAIVIIVLFSIATGAVGFCLSQVFSRREFIETTYVGLIQEKEELATKSDLDSLAAKLDKQNDKIDRQNEKIEKLLVDYGEVKGIMYITGAEPLKSKGSAPVINADMVFTDKSGEEYTTDELIGDRVLISFMEDDKEVYFLGKYNASYHWDGYCVTNSYNQDGTLSGICESNFDDGKRLDYISLYQNGGYFLYSNRRIEGDKNIGVTKHYKFDNSESKTFNPQNASAHDMKFVDSFLSSRKELIITEYYNGITSNEEFSDDTGKAVRITFDNDGFVESFYKGQFKNKNANDDTLQAYALIYVAGKGYYYNHNTAFENGKAKIKAIKPLKNADLESIVSDMEFDDLELKWHGIDDMF